MALNALRYAQGIATKKRNKKITQHRAYPNPPESPKRDIAVIENTRLYKRHTTFLE